MKKRKTKMKKLVMMLALVAAAFVAKGACVDWQVSATAADDGKSVYLLTAIEDFADVNALAAAAVSSSTVASAGRGKYGTPKATATGESVTKSADFYFAIVGGDGKSFTYVAATGLASNVYDPDKQESSAGIFSSVSYANIAAGTSKTFGGGGDGDVPEPTSGLLLLVGGAMLALRRKQK